MQRRSLREAEAWRPASLPAVCQIVKESRTNAILVIHNRKADFGNRLHLTEFSRSRRSPSELISQSGGEVEDEQTSVVT